MSTVPHLVRELDYLYALERFGIKLGLQVMEQLMVELGNPHQSFKSIHITGTNGKGSTASFIERILCQAGYQVGLYTSPHLYRFNERVRINGHDITDEQLMGHIARVRQAATNQSLQPTFFEFTTAVAFLEFARKKVDVAVIEVGMGGALDATNLITPEVAVITNIGLDHTPLLGTTKAEIAQNKSGIIKKDCEVVTAEEDQGLVDIFKQVCAQKNARLHHVDAQLAVTNRTQTLEGQTFAVKGSFNGNLEISMLGKHQIRNTCTALLTTMQLKQRGWNITDEDIAQGLAATTWPGRLDIVSRQPFMLVDGAHNDGGVLSLSTFLDEMKAALPHPTVLVVAAKKGKIVDELRDKIAARFTTIIVTQGNYEPMPAQELATILKRDGQQLEVIPDVAHALARAKQLVPSNGMILITGSLYMVGDALLTLQKTSL